MSIILFSNNCPRCKVLKTKLEQNNIEFEENNDVEFMAQKGFTTVPVLEVDGVIYSFKDAVEWIKEYKE
jgi:glutaredoxin